MKQHEGEIIEKAIRQSNVSISRLSMALRVSRKTIYNWFRKESLDSEIILRIGEVLEHDFSAEFPGIGKATVGQDEEAQASRRRLPARRAADYWKQKYIRLLKKYNRLMSERESETSGELTGTEF